MSRPTGRAADLEPEVREQIERSARQLKKSKWFRRESLADLRADLTVSWLKARPKFNPSRAALRTFAARVMANAARQMIRDRSRTKRGPARCGELDAPIRTGRTVTTTAALLTPSDAMRRLGLAERPLPETAADAVHAAIADLPPNLKAVCLQMNEGGVKPSQRTQTQFRAIKHLLRPHFEELGLEDFL